jgi:ATP-dependent helicase/DNAse subunit B
MGIKLSHSAKELYLRCPLAYYMHYFLYLRSKTTSSALLFGNAIDTGLNTLLLTYSVREAQDAFEKTWSFGKINNEEVSFKHTDLIRFSKADLDESLLTENMLKQPDNVKAWESLLNKGMMFIDTYAKEILPQIDKVLSVQERIELPNQNGDLITGLVDFVARFKDGNKLICDNKTTSVKYDRNVIYTKSQQLATYDEALSDKYGTTGVAYVVVDKKVRKKDPRVRIEIISGKINEEMKKKTFDEFDNVLHNIKMGNFKSNNPNCNNHFGNCTCETYVKSNGSDLTGLVELKKDKHV